MDTILIEHLWEFQHIPPSEGVRTANWKYLRYVNDKSSEELYDLSNDPRETKNLAADQGQASVLMSLRQKTDELIQRFADPYSGVPTGLTVEYIRKPFMTQVVDPKPEFSWIVPEEAGVQRAYQVLVASSKELIDQNIGDVWDSGQVRSNSSNNIRLGTSLQPNKAYYWKVRIFDKDNRTSDYSRVQKFESGDFDSGMLTTSNYFLIEDIKPVAYRKIDDDAYFVDFGKAAFATLELEYTPKTAENLKIRLGEKLLNGRMMESRKE